MTQPRFVAVGDVMLDVIASGGAGHGARIRPQPGGSAANAAVWAAACGAEATVIGRVGDDAAGRMIHWELEARGVRGALSIDPRAPTGTFLTVDSSIRADRGANAGFEPEHLPQSIEADAVLVSGYLPPVTVEAALRRARAEWVALDAARLASLPRGGNAVVANQDEAEKLSGEAAEQAVRTLGRRYRLACVTQGPLGAIAVLDGELESAEAPSTEVVDATGAGDALAAGLLVALLRGLPLRDALIEGCRCGALAAASPSPWPETPEQY
jgi:sugar/nucleoside kinase (ribokinase family)